MSDTAPTRLDAIWPAKWLIVAVALLLGAGVFLYVKAQPVSYSAQSSVRVTVPQTKNGARDSALASEELAAQYAQYATSTDVRSSAEKRLGAGVGQVTAVPLNNYNLIAVTASGSTAKQAAARSNAVAEALVDYVTTVNSSVVSAASKRVKAQLDSLDSQITSIRAQIKKLQAVAQGTGRAADLAQAEVASQQSLLSNLLNVQQNTLSGSTNDILVGQPDVAVVDQPQVGSPVTKHAPLYAVVAFLVALLALSEVAVLRARVRARGRTTRSSRSSSSGAAPEDEQGLDIPNTLANGNAPAATRPSASARSLR
ncbi:hypothetical protein EV189_2802 [Motilibacter rhizosphaerae]|uniref:Polysaccharide chain length determinant N-terminal domain-containing protein n=1 Tax=Motilibacter rhizosphaerae TaxID=598652 RepID=A0A4Q7NPW8_9ACTN|nr:Wzz/FepE/Etk N-terminal domain-containing protein [Motilibacter rhizosphaerae]RZS87374.1 hypothetical protein EV189_2802 [Motilibacter rhizosphaerae]